MSSGSSVISFELNAEVTFLKQFQSHIFLRFEVRLRVKGNSRTELHKKNLNRCPKNLSISIIK